MGAIKELNTISILSKADVKAWRQEKLNIIEAELNSYETVEEKILYQATPTYLSLLLEGTLGLYFKSNTEIAGLLVSKLPPITRPKMRTQRDEIDGRDGDIVTKLGYEAYDKEVELVLYGDYSANRVISYLTPEEGGYIVFSDDPDYCYEFQMYDEVGLERLLKFRKGKVKFHVQPYKYRLKEIDVLEDDGDGHYAKSVNVGSTELSQEYVIQASDTTWERIVKLLHQLAALISNFGQPQAYLMTELNAAQGLWTRTRSQLINWQSILNCGNTPSVPLYAFQWIPSSDLDSYFEMFLHKYYTDERDNRAVMRVSNPSEMFLWLDGIYYGGQFYSGTRTYYHTYDFHVDDLESLPADVRAMYDSNGDLLPPCFVNLYIDVKEQQCWACITQTDTDPLTVYLSNSEKLYSVNQFVRIDDWDRARLNAAYNLLRVYSTNSDYGGFKELWVYRRSRNL